MRSAWICTRNDVLGNLAVLSPLPAPVRLKRMDSEIGSVALQNLLGVNKSVLSELAQKGGAVSGQKRSSSARAAGRL